MIPLDSNFSDPSMTNGPDMGIPGFFIFAVIVVVGIGIVGTIVRVSMARSMARRAGLDPDDATAVTLLSADDGLAATYLASNLSPKVATAPAPPGEKPVGQRLAELDALRSSGSITEQEYAEQRSRVLGTV